MGEQMRQIIPIDYSGSKTHGDARIPPCTEAYKKLFNHCPAMMYALRSSSLFPSFIAAGYECSTHLQNYEHLDLTASTRHDVYAAEDYFRLNPLGIRCCRDGVSWPVSETSSGKYDFSRARFMMRAANQQNVMVIWDLMHFGWPRALDVFSTDFVERFAKYAAAFVRVVLEESYVGKRLIISPINEISFLSWAGGDRALFNPFYRERSAELKFQLARAAIEAMKAMRKVYPEVLFLHCDPIINVAARTTAQKAIETAEEMRLCQYQAWDMLCGHTWAGHLGGSDEFLNILGANFYRNNQRFLDGEFIDGDHRSYQPLSKMLKEVSSRYGKPMIISETGTEDNDRTSWLKYVAVESVRAIESGCDLHAITWFPILNHPGWVDNRHCYNGLWDYADSRGERELHQPLADEILRLNAFFSCDAFAGDLRHTHIFDSAGNH